MSARITHAALVGASSLLGKELLEQINSSAAAAWDLVLLEEGDDVEGRLLSAGDEAVLMHTLEEKSFAGRDIVLFAGSTSQTQQYLPAALAAGAAVVDLSGVAQGQSGFLLRSPYLATQQRPDLTTLGIVVPQTAAQMLALVAQRAAGAGLGQVEVFASVLEPASEAGSAGVDELHQQTISLLSFQDVPKDVFGAQVAFSVLADLPEDSKVPLAAREQRLRGQLDALLGDLGQNVHLQLIQAPVFHGYLITAFLLTEKQGSAATLNAALARDVIRVDTEAMVSNLAVTESGEVLLRLAESGHGGRCFAVQLAADNLRFAAQSAVSAGLELVALRPGSRLQ